MKIQSHIRNNLPTFGLQDSMKEVVRFFKHSTCSHVAVVDEGLYVGVLAEHDLATFEKDKTIEDYRFNLESFHVYREASWLDILEVFSRNDTNLLPVLEEGGYFLGYYDLSDMLEFFIETPFFTEPGGILVIAKGLKDYSFSEIAQIVESNNTKLLGAFITNMRNDVIQLTLKIGTENLNDVIQTFRRYNYSILFGNNDDQFLEDLRQRSDYLDKYLNV